MTKDYPELPPLPTSTVKYIVFRGEAIPITLYKDGLYRDPEGTIINVEDDNYAGPGADNRCGVGIVSLPNSDPDNVYCAPHDAAYSSRAYRAFHTREEADVYLLSLLKQAPTEQHSLLPWIFYGLARLFGGLIPHNWKKDDND